MLGLASRAGVQRSGQCALAVLGSTVAIQLLISTLSGQLVTLVNTMIDTYSLSTGAANLHWQKAAEVTLNSDILYWVLPGAVLLNLLMLACRVTRVLNMDHVEPVAGGLCGGTGAAADRRNVVRPDGRPADGCAADHPGGCLYRTGEPADRDIPHHLYPKLCRGDGPIRRGFAIFSSI